MASKVANNGCVTHGYFSELLKAAKIIFPQLSRKKINNHVVRIERAAMIHEGNTTADSTDETLDFSLPGEESESKADEEIASIESQPPDSDVDIESIDSHPDAEDEEDHPPDSEVEGMESADSTPDEEDEPPDSEATSPPDFGRPKGATDTAKREHKDRVYMAMKEAVIFYTECKDKIRSAKKRVARDALIKIIQKVKR